MRKLFLIIFILIFTIIPVFSTASQAGAIFLMIYPGARAMGMGGAYTAISDDALANYYNPAGMGLQEKRDVVLMHVNWLPALQSDMYYEYLALTYPTSSGVFGGSITYLTTGEIYATSEEDPTGRWRTFDIALSVSYANKIIDKLYVGASAKFIYSFLAPDWVVREFLGDESGGQGQSVGLDLGLMYLLNNSFTMGLSLSNIGPGISYIEGGDTDPLPLSLKFGVKYNVFENELHKMIISGDLNKVMVFSDSLPDNAFSFSFDRLLERANSTSDSLSLSFLETEILDIWLSFGTEYVYSNLLALRAGYFLDYLGKRIGFTFGGGVIINNSVRIDVGVDSNIYDFDTSNYRISIGFRF